jgi:hypothetical protein
MEASRRFGRRMMLALIGTMEKDGFDKRSRCIQIGCHRAAKIRARYSEMEKRITLEQPESAG